MVTRNMATQWRIHIFILGICGVLSSNPEFVAPVDPCRPQDVICPVTCNLMKMSGSTDCEFCFCKNPIDSEWPDTTSTTSTTPSTTTTLPPGHSIVNNVHYVELKNPCVLSNAMCPLQCIRRNVTLDSGKVCERCECPDVHARLDGQQSILVGKRAVSKESVMTEVKSTGEQAYLVRKNQNPEHGHGPPPMMHHEFWNRPCMPFFTCPILTCPAGQHLPVTSNGCRICQCVDNQNQDLLTAATTTPRPVTTTAPTAPPTTIDPANFLEMFCLPKADYCPSMCHVTNYRVGSWNCFHCTCPDGQTFVALQKPCDVNSNVCPSNCSIRKMEDSVDPTTSCQFCDCVKSSSVIYRKQPPALRINIENESSTETAVQRMRKFLMGPGHNSHIPNSGPMQAGNGFDYSQYIPGGPGFQAYTNEPSSHQPVQDHVTMAKTTVRPAPTEDPENNCLTNADECPTNYCSLKIIGRQCNLCLCGNIYFRDSDVGIFSILNTNTSTPSTSPPVTPTPTTPTILTLPTTVVTTPSTEASTNTAPSTTATLTQSPLTSFASTPAPSIVLPVTHAALSTPTSCYTCNDTNCKSTDLKTCEVGKDYCMNTIRQDRHGTRDFSRECVGEEDCYDKWWIHTMNNPVCLGMYNTEKGPANQPEVCYFCCKGPSCNSAARIEDYNLYTGDDHVIGRRSEILV
ncbi:uncharacterized protein LOC110462709 isoform X2 [Mizuhopecten yessoensis]|uniref:uncharacterized protein LOC110462709 isoform X2 n=1 Tax=Mizuhopecten yessoensis TaxID=6573 RepID=UPI000B45D3F1|nr:uncharacterized protein LOC110462709 isoform X2 [Mizuhopecten yessoensis]